MSLLVVFIAVMEIFPYLGKHDSATQAYRVGIYCSQSSFIKNMLSFKSNTLPVFHCLGIFNCEIDIYTNFNISGKIKFKCSNNLWVTVKPGSIFGFAINGHKYIYKKSFKEYLLLIDETRYYFYLTRPSMKAPMELYFAKKLNEIPIPFNEHQIKKLKAEPSTKRLLIDLYRTLPDHFNSNKKAYDSYVGIIHRYMGQALILIKDENKKVQWGNLHGKG